MSKHAVIAEVGKFLVKLLQDGCKEDLDTGTVMLAPPKKPEQNGSQPKLTLWLYSVIPNEHLRNAPNLRVQIPARGEVLQFPPLALNLLYLLTPQQPSDEQSQRLLGRAMQVLNDSAVTLFPGVPDDADPEELHISLQQHAIQELAEVWEALQEPYRLSVCYQVRVVRIPSGREISAGDVHERSTEFEPMGAAS